MQLYFLVIFCLFSIVHSLVYISIAMLIITVGTFMLNSHLSALFAQL